MCELTTATVLAGLGVAASAGGAAYSANAQSNAASAQRDANAAAISSQNAGFYQRLNSERAQTAAQGQAQNSAQQALQDSFNTTRAQQNAALSTRDQTLASENASADSIRAAADQQQQQLLDNTNATALAQSQATDAANRTGSMAPIASDLEAASPLAAMDTASSATKGAYASRLAEAANNVRAYGQRLANVSSYTAPLTTVGNAIQQEQLGIMPTAAANQLLQSGQQQRLAPATLAYQQAGSQGQARQSMIGAALQGDLDTAKLAYSQSTNAADLQQGNANTLAGNTAKNAAADALAAQGIGTLASTVGNIAAYGSQRYADPINAYTGTPSTTKKAA